MPSVRISPIPNQPGKLVVTFSDDHKPFTDASRGPIIWSADQPSRGWDVFLSSEGRDIVNILSTGMRSTASDSSFNIWTVTISSQPNSVSPARLEQEIRLLYTKLHKLGYEIR